MIQEARAASGLVGGTNGPRLSFTSHLARLLVQEYKCRPAKYPLFIARVRRWSKDTELGSETKGSEH